MSGECAAAGGRVRRPQRRPTCGVTFRSHPVSGVSPAYLRCFRRTQWAVGKVGECLGVISRLVSLDFDQRSAQETVAMPRRVNASKSAFSKNSSSSKSLQHSVLRRGWGSPRRPPPRRTTLLARGEVSCAWLDLSRPQVTALSALWTRWGKCVSARRASLT